MFEAGFAYILSKSLMNTRTNTALMETSEQLFFMWRNQQHQCRSTARKIFIICIFKLSHSSLKQIKHSVLIFQLTLHLILCFFSV